MLPKKAKKQHATHIQARTYFDTFWFVKQWNIKCVTSIKRKEAVESQPKKEEYQMLIDQRNRSIRKWNLNILRPMAKFGSKFVSIVFAQRREKTFAQTCKTRTHRLKMWLSHRWAHLNLTFEWSKISRRKRRRWDEMGQGDGEEGFDVDVADEDDERKAKKNMRGSKIYACVAIELEQQIYIKTNFYFIYISLSFGIRLSSNSKSNRVRWLRFKLSWAKLAFHLQIRTKRASTDFLYVCTLEISA